jgi:hypothetical protein
MHIGICNVHMAYAATSHRRPGRKKGTISRDSGFQKKKKKKKKKKRKKKKEGERKRKIERVR